MAAEKTYIGSGRQKAGSEYITLSLCLEDILNAETSEFNGKTYIKAIVAKRRTPDQYGKTHTVYVPEAPDMVEIVRNRLMDQQERETRREEM